MITNSTDFFDKSTLLKLLKSEYGFTNVQSMIIRTGEDGNQTYKLMVSKTPYILRIYGTESRENPDWVQYELELLKHLKSKNISVSVPLTGHSGSMMHLITLDSGVPAPFGVFTFANGEVVWPASPQRGRQLGKAFAELHLAADSFQSDCSHRVFDAERLFDESLQRMRMYLDDKNINDRAAWDTLFQTAETSKSLLKAIPDSASAIGPIHGDLHQGNCHFSSDEGEETLSFFDFSNAGSGWRVYDLSGFLWPMRDDTIHKVDMRAACEGFLEGYRSVRPLLIEEERAIVASVKARDFWEAGNWLKYGQNLDPEIVRKGLHSYADQFRRYPLD